MIGTIEIEELFEAELAQIEDVELRRQVIAAWVLGCRRGSWESVEQLRGMPFTLLTPTHGIGFVEHTRAVTVGAVGLALAQVEIYGKLPYPLDMDRLVAGGLLHDVGKLLEIASDGQGGFRKSRNGMCTRHPISGVVLAAEVGLPEEVLNIIACHAKEGDGRPKVPEAILIHQADFATFDPLVMLNQGSLIL